MASVSVIMSCSFIDRWSKALTKIKILQLIFIGFDNVVMKASFKNTLTRSESIYWHSASHIKPQQNPITAYLVQSLQFPEFLWRFNGVVSNDHPKTDTSMFEKKYVLTGGKDRVISYRFWLAIEQMYITQVQYVYEKIIFKTKK